VAIKGERGNWCIASVVHGFEFRVRENLGAALPGCHKNFVAAMTEAYLVGLDSLLMRSKWCRLRG
jgi:hypothetical protein